MGRLRRALDRFRRFVRRFFSRRFVGLTALTGFGLLCFLIGLGSAAVLTGFTLDGGLATLIGSAAGAAITVGGSVWLSHYQAKAESRTFTRVVGEAASSICDNAYLLMCWVAPEGWSNNEEYAMQLRHRVELLQESIGVFRQYAPFSEIRSYEARLSIYRFDAAVTEATKVIEKELLWLDTPTIAVLSNARNALSLVGMNIFDASFEIARKLGIDRPLPEQEAHRLEDRYRRPRADA